MTNFNLSPNLAHTRAGFEDLVSIIRPELLRYAARMVGSVIDGEDVVQEALAKAFQSLSSLNAESNMRGWLFRITHNKAIDFLRRLEYQTMEELDENLTARFEPEQPLEKKELAGIALSVFLQLNPRQRSCVILKDVLDYSLAEISEFLNATVPEIKAVLHRGRTRLRELAGNLEKNIPVLKDRERELLTRYIDRFNARDFDGVLELLAADTKLDLLNKAKLSGSTEINNNYFHNYKQLADWRFKLGFVENHPAILVFSPSAQSAVPAYFILISWADDHISLIRDYRYARYVINDAEIIVL